MTSYQTHTDAYATVTIQQLIGDEWVTRSDITVQSPDPDKVLDWWAIFFFIAEVDGEFFPIYFIDEEAEEPYERHLHLTTMSPARHIWVDRYFHIRPDPCCTSFEEAVAQATLFLGF